MLDTNVLVAAMRSPKGASARLVLAASRGELAMVANPALFLEYESVLTRAEHIQAAGLSPVQVESLLRNLAAIIVPAAPGPLLRPMLTDPDDEFVLEAAVYGAASIVTFEIRTFEAVGRSLGVEVMTPAAAWARIK